MTKVELYGQLLDEMAEIRKNGTEEEADATTDKLDDIWEAATPEERDAMRNLAIEKNRGA